MEYIRQRFTPTNVSARSGDVVFDLGDVTYYNAHNAAVYLSDDWDLNDRLKINLGIRSTYFAHIGSFVRYVQDPTFPGKFTDTIRYERGDLVQDYFRTEPRFSLRYQINNSSSVKASYTKNFQFLHLASYGSVSLPTDTWMPSTDLIKPQEGWQSSLGYFKNIMGNAFEGSIEVYYKEMNNMIEYREGSTPDQDVKNNPDNNFVFGNGRSYGTEFFFKKATGAITGWIGYTLSWTWREFPEVNGGKEYPAKYDRRHDVSFVLTWEKNRKWTYGMTWVYSTGDALTLPQEKYLLSMAPPFSVDANGISANGNFGVFSQYGERNSFRQKPYHRLDLSATYHVKKHKRWESDWVFSLYNTYGRLNPYFIYFSIDGNSADGNLSIQAKQVSLFSIIPSVTYNFRF
jgi:hypothetical protein